MVAVFLATGFEEIEALAPVDILRRAGVEVCIVGVGEKTIIGAHGITVLCDFTDHEVLFDKVEMMVLPGGMPGAANLEACPTVQKLLEHCSKHQKWIAAICAAPFVLGHKGLLKGKSATCYPGFEKELTDAVCTGLSVECDGNVITGKGPGAALEFAFALAGALKGDSVAQKLRGDMQCR